uniref:Uncharacterized protein n=1 Tax=Bubo bubo TaxID=30461 RepID=A0A8C0EW97_BUBBB
ISSPQMTESPPPVALPVGAAEYAESVDCDNLLDPDTINPKREPGLCLPLAGDDPWVKVRQEALVQGDMDMARKIVAPVICEPGHQPRCGGLQFSVIKELQKSVNEDGLQNSFTTGILEWFVAKALSPVRMQVPQAVIYHYMDDILIAAETQEIMEKALALTKDSVSQMG